MQVLSYSSIPPPKKKRLIISLFPLSKEIFALVKGGGGNKLIVRFDNDQWGWQSGGDQFILHDQPLKCISALVKHYLVHITK